MTGGRFVRRLSALRSFGPNLAGLATPAACLLAWEAAIRTGLVEYEYLPAPFAILRGAGELVVSGELADAMVHTLASVLLGWAVAVIAGVSFGLLLGASPAVRRWSLASIEVMRPMPAIAFVPMALLLFGFSIETELMVVILPSLWPVMINTMGGVAGVHPRLVEVGRTLQLSRTVMLRNIILPAAMPAILVGARLSLTLALVLAVLAEMVGNPAGLGYAVVTEQ